MHVGDMNKMGRRENPSRGDGTRVVSDRKVAREIISHTTHERIYESECKDTYDTPRIFGRHDWEALGGTSG